MVLSLFRSNWLELVGGAVALGDCGASVSEGSGISGFDIVGEGEGEISGSVGTTEGSGDICGVGEISGEGTLAGEGEISGDGLGMGLAATGTLLL